MFSTLFTWVKRAFYVSSLFLGLYYFGDFRINNVNVRDTLQSWIPPERMNSWRARAIEKTASVVKKAYDKIDEKYLHGDNVTVESLDKISVDDQKKMVDLLKSNIEQAMDPQTQANVTQQFKDVMDVVGGAADSGSGSALVP